MTKEEEAIKMLRHCEAEDYCYDGIHGTCKGCNKRAALDMAIEALEANKPENEWIPISERLPEDGEWAIWCSNDGVIGIARFKEDCYNHFYPNETIFDLEDAVAWMPLPEPYKDSADNERDWQMMTKVKAIECLERIYQIYEVLERERPSFIEQYLESKIALAMAIDALKAQDRPIICPRCGRTFSEAEGRER